MEISLENRKGLHFPSLDFGPPLLARPAPAPTARSSSRRPNHSRSWATALLASSPGTISPQQSKRPSTRSSRRPMSSRLSRLSHCQLVPTCHHCPRVRARAGHHRRCPTPLRPHRVRYLVCHVASPHKSRAPQHAATPRNLLNRCSLAELLSHRITLAADEPSASPCATLPLSAPRLGKVSSRARLDRLSLPVLLLRSMMIRRSFSMSAACFRPWRRRRTSPSASWRHLSPARFNPGRPSLIQRLQLKIQVRPAYLQKRPLLFLNLTCRPCIFSKETLGFLFIEPAVQCVNPEYVFFFGQRSFFGLDPKCVFIYLQFCH